MLFAVRNYLLLLTLIAATGLFPVAAGQSDQQPNQTAEPPAAPAQPAQPAQQVPGPAPAPAVVQTGPVIVLNPAHGGTDTGARGANGITEKDVVLQFARTMRGEIMRQGFRVAMTRDDDSNPSYDDRAATGNAFRDAIFISIHVSSTGAAGTARAYYYRFSSSLPTADVSGTPGADTSAPVPPLAVPGFTPWAEAQKPYDDASHHFADVLQGELAQRFSGSPSASAGVAIRGLQSVAGPAIAVEISSVSIAEPSSLMSLGAPLATSVSRAILAFRPPGSAETK